MKIRSAGWFRDKATFRSEELRETAIRLRKRTRDELLAKRWYTNQQHLASGKSFVQRGWTKRIYPHSSDSQRARYAKQGASK